jgi:O-6-methylguanine DNA methyltransferase
VSDTLEDTLRTLRTTAPPTLGHGALVRVGLADWIAPLTTPLGPAVVAWNANGVSSLYQGEDVEQLAFDLRRRSGRPSLVRDELPDDIGTRIEEVLAGRRRTMDVDMRGIPPFQADVLQATLQIPWGEVRPYGWVAREIGRPGAVRAVGTALGRNPIPLIVPCHRVVRSDGMLGQYGWGAPAKRVILAYEGLDPDATEELARHRVAFIGSDTSGIYCYPSCRNARQTPNRERVPLRSARQAAARGLSPCPGCRPPAATV